MFQLLAERTTGFQTVVVTHHVLPTDVQQSWSINRLIASSEMRTHL
ncbi:hypothetical protein [Micromonospora sp. NPDC005806]